jgi:hypothetical protein
VKLLRAAALIAVALAAAGCRSQPKPKPARAVPAVGWRPVGVWSGHGNAQTESFNIESGQWRIKWQATHESPPGAGTLLVTAHSAVSGRPLMVAVDHRGPGSGTAYVNEEPRLFHLVVESSNIDWSVTVEEGVVGP